MKIMVRFNSEIPTTIFEEPILQKQVDSLLDGAKEQIKQRVDNLIKVLALDYTDKLSYDEIIIQFKAHFCKLILTEAVGMALSEWGRYNILDNILSLLTEEKLEMAITEKTMIDAISDTIYNLLYQADDVRNQDLE